MILLQTSIAMTAREMHSAKYRTADFWPLWTGGENRQSALSGPQRADTANSLCTFGHGVHSKAHCTLASEQTAHCQHYMITRQGIIQ